jgi:hypothetical protein
VSAETAAAVAVVAAASAAIAATADATVVDDIVIVDFAAATTAAAAIASLVYVCASLRSLGPARLQITVILAVVVKSRLPSLSNPAPR